MRIPAAIVAISTLLLVCSPARAGALYPLPCRVYVDTDFIQIPGQCATVLRTYPRRLFVRAARQSPYYYGPHY
jgi:hypothetical protein